MSPWGPLQPASTFLSLALLLSLTPPPIILYTSLPLFLSHVLQSPLLTLLPLPPIDFCPLFFHLYLLPPRPLFIIFVLIYFPTLSALPLLSCLLFIYLWSTLQTTVAEHSTE